MQKSGWQSRWLLSAKSATSPISQLYPRRLAFDGAFHLEKLGRLKTKEARDNHARKGLDEIVQVAHGAVIKPPGILEIVLNLDQRGAQLAKILVCLQVGI